MNSKTCGQLADECYMAEGVMSFEEMNEAKVMRFDSMSLRQERSGELNKRSLEVRIPSRSRRADGPWSRLRVIGQ